MILDKASFFNSNGLISKLISYLSDQLQTILLIHSVRDDVPLFINSKFGSEEFLNFRGEFERKALIKESDKIKWQSIYFLDLKFIRSKFFLGVNGGKIKLSYESYNYLI